MERNPEHERIWREWHEAARNRDHQALIALYADDAILESPLVQAICPERSQGILRGKAEIAEFLREGAKRRPNALVRWHRTPVWFSCGDTLVWEYPRETPNGDQIDILEVMRIADGKIAHQRIYWGWKGCAWIAPALARSTSAV